MATLDKSASVALQSAAETDRQQAQYHFTKFDRIKAYAHLPGVSSRFQALLGRDAQFYVEGVLNACIMNERLLECSPRSIVFSALRAASLRCSVDPALSQAHLVPYGKVCTLVLDYHELVNWTCATGIYEVAPDVAEIYEGEVATVNRLTHRVTIEGEKKSDVVIGFLGYLKTQEGVERFLYWSNEECDAWGRRYNPVGFAHPKSPWNTEREKMRKKTVLRQLVKRYGRFTASQQAALQAMDRMDATPDMAMTDDQPEIIDLPDDRAAEEVLQAKADERHERFVNSSPDERNAWERAALQELGFFGD